MMKLPLALILLLGVSSSLAKTILQADGSDTYTLFNRVLGTGTGNSMEVPDCGHNQKHITQGNDGELNHQVFFFHAHRDLDDDRCINTDRQRVEIKTNAGHLHGGHGATTSYSWNFKLDAGFQPSTAFTHIFQLKAVDGNDGNPLITITPRKGSPNTLQIIHVDNNNVNTHIGSTPLAPFLGTWVHVVEEATFWNGGGHIKITLSRLSDGQQLYSVEKSNIDMWRDGASYVRGKWGIYRSLNDIGSLRDEVVRFENFCFATGTEKCT